MKAIILNEPGGADKLTYTEIEKPVISEKEVLVQVKAISINPVDVKVRAGHGVYQLLKSDQPLILGWDISGVVVEAGGRANFIVGDEVFGMVRFPGHAKAYAEYVAAPADQLALKPTNVSHEEAASATLAALTAYQALVVHANVKSGDKVLVHAAAGGVGHFAVQVAKHLGAIVTGTSSAKNKDFVRQLGADEHIDYRGYDWQNSVARFDMVLDTVGGDNFEKSLAVVDAGATVISIPSGLSESVTEKAKAKAVNSLFFLVNSNGVHMAIIADWLRQGILKPHVSQTFGFDQMADAHRQVETGKTAGKVIVRV
ncbi:NADPH:quinone reductase [Dyadobacter beijingensis]|uniref:NADPH:quinone reductase n=1 Tax=Dyadobacter beijingensis TaxID=365489 RepID=A0ABQ2IMS5_9BACT|nr:NADP-dependent oxidoreductase [Dyadobacter beijingensis]GGN13484.1 NADPH:quinone reductase [Dyadobacter beijingensis]